MSLPASERTRWALVVAVGALLLAALNLWWVMRFREGYPFDIDEAGYTVFGLIDYFGLRDNGLEGWWSAIQNQPTFAPLVPALTSFLVYVDPGVMNGFMVLTAFLVVLTMAIYGIGAQLAGPRLGAFAALVTATMPGAFAFSREYVYALPTAALLACAIYALIRSDGLRLRRWAIACGAALGLMLLARTMAIVYVPGVLAAGLVVAFARGRGDLTNRFVNLALVVATGVATAATWYARNLQSVIDYLTNYGYGSQSKYYGADHSLVSVGRLRSVAERMTSEDLFFPLAVVLAIGLIAMTVVVVRSLLPRETRRTFLERLGATDALSVAIVLLLGYAALMSSQNGGNGFTLPLAALLPTLAVLILRRFPAALVPAVAATALIAAVNILSTATIWSTASSTRMISVPGFREEFPLTKGMPKAVFALRLQIPGPETTFDDEDVQWLEADREVLELLAGLYGPHGEAPVVGFAARNRALTTNSIQLASVLKYQRGIPFVQLEAEPNDSVSTYTEQLTDPETGIASALVTMSSTAGDFPPIVTQSYAETAARRLGFHRIDTMPLPDGRRLRLWVKRDEEPALVSCGSSRKAAEASDCRPGSPPG
jgi:hypothetical protein